MACYNNKNTIIYDNDNSIYYESKFKKPTKKRRFTIFWDLLDLISIKDRKKVYIYEKK